MTQRPLAETVLLIVLVPSNGRRRGTGVRRCHLSLRRWRYFLLTRQKWWFTLSLFGRFNERRTKLFLSIAPRRTMTCPIGEDQLGKFRVFRERLRPQKSSPRGRRIPRLPRRIARICRNGRIVPTSRLTVLPGTVIGRLFIITSSRQTVPRKSP